MRELRMATDDPTAEPSPQSLAFSPATAVQNLYAAIGQALADAAKNATAAQQQGNILALSATTEGLSTLFSVDTATLGLASKEELDKGLAKAQAGLARSKPR
jgi:hypothetical protein